MTMDNKMAFHVNDLKRIADVDACGVVAVAETNGTPLFDSALALLPEAKSIIVLEMEIFPEILDLVTPEKRFGEAAAGDLFGPHQDYLSSRLNRGIYILANNYRRSGFRSIPLPSQGTPTDTRFQRGLLSFKHAGEFAGLGKIGYNSLLVSPQFGPRMRLACLLTEAALPPTPRLAQNPCDGCGQCVEHCPAGALTTPNLDQPYVINKFACASFRQGATACSTCMRVCPVARR
jgi:epoxyqueuosine reductase QueG